MTWWTHEMTIKLIEEFRSRPLLWDASVPDYKNRDKKRDALKEVAEIVKYDVDEVDKKIRNLKIQFRREHKSMCARINSGRSPKKAGWFGYDLLLFLLPSTEARGSRSTISGDYEDEEEARFQEDDDLTEVDANIYPLPQATANCTSDILKNSVMSNNLPNLMFRKPLPKDNKKRRYEQAHDAFNVMREMNETVTKRDEFSVFGELVAYKLRKCKSAPRSVAVAQRAINEILFDLEMEQYSTMAQINNTQSEGNYSGYPFAGRLDTNQHYSPSNTSASSSPSILTENAHHLNQPDTNTSTTTQQYPRE